MPKDPALRMLRKFAGTVRHIHAEEPGFVSFIQEAVPADLARPDFSAMMLVGRQVRAFGDVVEMLAHDLRFEWLTTDQAEAAVWRLACEARANPTGSDGSLAEAFVRQRARDPLTELCYFAVDGLTVEADCEVFGIKLLPTNTVTLHPRASMFGTLDDVDCIAAVEVTGTHGDRMAARGQELVEHALRLLRFTLRAPMKFRDPDLRFQVGNVWWTESGAHRWTRPRLPRPVHLDADLVAMARAQPVADVRAQGGSDVDERSRVALAWFERSQREDELLSELLYLFCALEAILGDERQKLKGENLALRRAVLGHLTTGRFSHPARAHRFYAEVRSTAVHGSKLKLKLTEEDVTTLSHDVRAGINQFVEHARQRGFTKRRDLVASLDADPAREELARRLHMENSKLWSLPEKPD